MVNIPVAPFYVPRPAEEQVWLKGPLASGVIPKVTSNISNLNVYPSTQKYFDSQFYDYQMEMDVRAAVNHRPITQLAGMGLTSVSTLDYRTGIDDLPPWSITFQRDTAALNVVVPSTPLPARQSRFDTDDSSLWSMTFHRVVLAPPLNIRQAQFNSDDTVWYGQHSDVPQTLGIAPTQTPFRTPLYIPWQDENNPWQLTFRNNVTLVPTPFTFDQVRFDYNDSAVWQMTFKKDIVLNSVTPLIIYQSNFNFYDSSVWLATIQRSIVLPLAPVANDFIPTKMHFRIDDYAVSWQQTYRNNVALVPVITSAPFIADQPKLDYNDTAVSWQQSYRNNVALVPAVTTKPFSNFNLNQISDNQVWSLTFHHNALLVSVVTPTPVKTPFYIPQQDDFSNWLFEPDSSPIILSLVLYQLGNQLSILSSSPYDDYSVWNQKSNQPTKLISAFVAQTLFRAPIYVPRQDEINYWQWVPPNPVALSFQPYNFSGIDIQYWNDFAEWDGALPPQQTNLAINIQPIVTQQFLFRAPFYVPKSDDYSVWYQKVAQATKLITPTVTTTLPRAPFYSSKSDDYSVWYKQIAQATRITAVVPARIPRAPFYYTPKTDDYSVWQQQVIQPTRIVSAVIITTLPRSPFYVLRPAEDANWIFQPDSSPIILSLVLYQLGNQLSILSSSPYDDYSLWSPTSQRDLAVATALPMTPIIPSVWRFQDTDVPPWQYPQYNIRLSFVPSINNNWRIGLSDDQPWSLSSHRFIAPTPAVVNHWHLDLSDDQPWSFTAHRFISPPAPSINYQYSSVIDDPFWQWSVRGLALTPVPAMINRWRLDIPDDQPWAVTAQHVTLSPVPAVVNRWRLDIPDDQPWSLSIQHSLPLTAVPIVIKPYAFTIDDFTIWSWTGKHSQLSIAPIIAYHRELGIPNEQSWTKTNYWNHTLILNVPESFTIRQPSFAYDDHSSYQWLVRSSIILSLKWDIDCDRIAITKGETRVAAASVEKRTANTSIETRTADTTKENRTADTEQENRIVDAPEKDR